RGPERSRKGRPTVRSRSSPALRALPLVALLAAPVAFAGEGGGLREKVRTGPLRLPHDGPFDLLSFEESNGRVALGGKVCLPMLRKEAEEAVRALPGVKEVEDRLEVDGPARS
ncbi:MAG TPA: BON domain-containing protein, partial [Thermoanaerobaculia bacterium]|nr:BON domain-containing protein [Thermoanaerobaculia bacterium]